MPGGEGGFVPPEVAPEALVVGFVELPAGFAVPTLGLRPPAAETVVVVTVGRTRGLTTLMPAGWMISARVEAAVELSANA